MVGSAAKTRERKVVPATLHVSQDSRTCHVSSTVLALGKGAARAILQAYRATLVDVRRLAPNSVNLRQSARRGGPVPSNEGLRSGYDPLAGTHPRGRVKVRRRRCSLNAFRSSSFDPHRHVFGVTLSPDRSRRYSLKLFESVTKSEGIISTVVLLFSAPTSEII